jgi:hypothetical protein
MMARSDSFQQSLTIFYRSGLSSNTICASPNAGVAIKRHVLLGRRFDDARERCEVNSKQYQPPPAQWYLALGLSFSKRDLGFLIFITQTAIITSVSLQLLQRYSTQAINLERLLQNFTNCHLEAYLRAILYT